MNKITVMSSWIGTGTTLDPNRPKFVDDYPTLAFSDITSQPSENLPTTPNALVATAYCDDDTLAIIEADATCLVLTSEIFVVKGEVVVVGRGGNAPTLKDKNEPPDPTEKQRIKSYLHDLGLNQNHGDAGSRKQIEDAIIGECRTLPKG